MKLKKHKDDYLILSLYLQCFGHVSGAHINPIVTVAAAVLGNLPLVQVPIYLFGQFTGAIAGFGILKVGNATS